MRASKSLAERLWEKVQKHDDGCWLWTGSTSKQGGYGYLHSGSKTVRKPLKAHRVSWELSRGSIPEGLWVLHKCDTPACVRPDHLFLGDRSDNMRDCAAKGRVTTIGKSRLTHCKHGHEFTAENTIRLKTGHRRCKTCATAQRKARRAAIRATTPKATPNSMFGADRLPIEVTSWPKL